MDYRSLALPRAALQKKKTCSAAFSIFVFCKFFRMRAFKNLQKTKITKQSFAILLRRERERKSPIFQALTTNISLIYRHSASRIFFLVGALMAHWLLILFLLISAYFTRKRFGKQPYLELYFCPLRQAAFQMLLHIRRESFNNVIF